MATDLATLSVRVQANFDRYNRAFKKAVADTNRHMSKIERRVSRGRKRVQASFAAMGKVAGRVGAVGVVSLGTAMAAGVKSSLQFADSIKKMSDSTGIGIERLQGLMFAAEQTGVGAAFAAKGFERFRQRLGDFSTTGKGPAAEAFAILGVNIRDMNDNLRPTEAVLDEVMAKLAGVKDPARQAALASKFFGEEAGPQMARLLAVGIDKIKEYEREAPKMSAALVEEADDILKAWNLLITTMDVNWKTFKNVWATGIIGMGKTAARALNIMSESPLTQLDDLRQKQSELLDKTSKVSKTIEDLTTKALAHPSEFLNRKIEVMRGQLEGGVKLLDDVNKKMIELQTKHDPDVQKSLALITSLNIDDDDDGKGGGRAVTKKDVYGDIIKSIKERTAALESEKLILIDTADERLKIANLEAEITAREKAGLEVSMSLRMRLAEARAAEAGELERLEIIYDALNELAAEGIALTPRMEKKLKKLAETMGVLRAETEKVAEAEEARREASDAAADAAEKAADKQKEVQDAMKDSARNAIGVLAELSKGTLEWEDALLAVLDILIRMQEAGALEDILGGGKSGKGGFDLFGSLLGGIGGLFGGGGNTNSIGASILAAPGAGVGYADGGRPPVGRPAIVGERGPELFMPDRAGSIINARDTAAMLKPANSNRSQAGVTINAPININAPMTQEQTMFTANQIEKSLGRVARRGVGRL